MTFTAVGPKQGGARTWRAYSLAIALAPFGNPSSWVARPYPGDRLSLRPGPRPGYVAVGRRRCAHQPAAAATSAWRLAWPAGMPSLLWAAAAAGAAVPPTGSGDKGVIWGLNADAQNETQTPGARAFVPRPAAGPAACTREAMPPGGNASWLTTSRGSRRYPRIRMCGAVRFRGQCV